MDTKELTRQVRLSHWAGIMRERSASGKSVRSWCMENGIIEKTYYYWQRKLREAAYDQFNEVVSLQQNVPDFVEVKLPEAPTPKLLPDVRGPNCLVVEVGEVRLSADNNYPPESLAILLRELIKL